MTTASTAQASGAMTMPALALISADTLQACTVAYGGWQQEMAHFIDLRLAHNRQSWEALMAARDVGSVVKVQQQWGLQAAADYTREAARLAHLFSTFSLTGTTPAVQETAKLVA
jgi:hypothetical protein